MTTLDDARRAIDLIGLEYPADIKATYDDLPTTYDKLLLLREHLHYLYIIGTESNNDELADYALFANLHVRYRMLCFQSDLEPADEFYFKTYEQKLPRMKWRPYIEHQHVFSTTPEDEDVQYLIVPDVNEVSIIEDLENDICDSFESPFPTELICTPAVIVHPPAVEFEFTYEDKIPPIDEEKYELVTFSRKYGRGFNSNDLTIEVTRSVRTYIIRINTEQRPIVSLYGFGTWIFFNDDVYRRLYSSIRGNRYAGYQDGCYFVSATAAAKYGLPSLFSMALRELSKAWLLSNHDL